LFKGPRHQPVFRFHGQVLTLDSLRRQPCSLQTLLPLAIDASSFAEHILCRRGTQFHSPRSQGTRHLGCNGLIQLLAKKLVTALNAFTRPVVAGVSELRMLGTGICHIHPMLASAASHQARPERRPFASRSARLGLNPIG
jgi:hypothetical protein